MFGERIQTIQCTAKDSHLRQFLRLKMFGRFPQKKTVCAIAVGALVALVSFGLLCLFVPDLRHPKVVFMFIFCFISAVIIMCCSVKSGRPRSRETSVTKEEEANSGPPTYEDAVNQTNSGRMTSTTQPNGDLCFATKPGETDPPLHTAKL